MVYSIKNELNGQKILVTGAAGFIGSALANFLCKNNEVTGIDNLSSGDWQRCHSEVKKLEIDLTKIREIELLNLLEGQDLLFHLAAVKLHNSLNSDHKIIESNIVASNRLFSAAGKAGVKRVVFTSSLYANGSLGPKMMFESDRENPKTLYGASKLFSEKDLVISSSKFGYSYAIPRLFFVYGPQQYAMGGYKSVIVSNFQRALQDIPMQINGSGDQVLDYIYISDCIDAIVGIARSNFKGVIHVSSGQGVSIHKLIETMNHASGKSQVAYMAPDWTEGTFRIGSNELMCKVLGRKPKISLIEGLSLTWKSISDAKS